MHPAHLAVLLTVALSVVTAAGDYCLKRSCAAPNFLASPWFAWGFALYASTTFGWAYVMRSMKLAHVGVRYSLTHVLMAVAVGAVCFDESLNRTEAAAVVMALTSLALLVRFG